MVEITTAEANTTPVIGLYGNPGAGKTTLSLTESGN
jgi:hypothetical protein